MILKLYIRNVVSSNKFLIEKRQILPNTCSICKKRKYLESAIVSFQPKKSNVPNCWTLNFFSIKKKT